MASKSTSSSRKSPTAKKRATKGPAQKKKPAPTKRKSAASAASSAATPGKSPKKKAATHPRKTATGLAKAAEAAKAAAEKKTVKAAARKSGAGTRSRPRAGEERCVLACHPDVSVLRLIREALAGLADVRVDTAPTAERAFELAMQSEYQLFFFGLRMPEIGGELLYEFIEKAYRHGGSGRFAAPGVAFLGSANVADEKEQQLRRDARVKGVLSPPLKIDRVLELTEDAFGRASASR